MGTTLVSREGITWEWKEKEFRDCRMPRDALFPSCQVYLQLSPGSPEILDSDITEMHDWFYVVRYQACLRSEGSFFPEIDEVRGTDNDYDYESEPEQLKDTYAYGEVSWGFILFITLFFGGLFLIS